MVYYSKYRKRDQLYQAATYDTKLRWMVLSAKIKLYLYIALFPGLPTVKILIATIYAIKIWVQEGLGMRPAQTLKS